MSAKRTSRIKAAGRDDVDLELERGEEREGIRPTLDQKGKEAFVFWTALLQTLERQEEKQAPKSCHLPVVNKFHKAHMRSVWYLSRAGLLRKNGVVLLGQQVPALVLTHEHQSACYQKDFFPFLLSHPKFWKLHTERFQSSRALGQAITKHCKTCPTLCRNPAGEMAPHSNSHLPFP